MHPGTHKVTFTGRIWTIDSWDGETFTVEMKNSHGTVMDSVQVRGNNFEGVADVTLSCDGSVGGWQDGYFDVMLTSDYNQDMGDVTVRVTTTLDQGAGDESIGYGNMQFNYDFDPSIPWVQPSSNDFDDGVDNPMSLWQSNCGATEQTCQGHTYIGGFNQCAQGHSFWREFPTDGFHPGAEFVRLTGRVWTIDSWDGETFTVEMKAGSMVLDTVTIQGNNFASLGDETLECENTAGHWQDGYFNVALQHPYSRAMGPIEVRITSTLDQGAGDESIGIGDFKLDYDYDPEIEEPTFPTESPADYDAGNANPSALW
jgi:hypothetical protein